MSAPSSSLRPRRLSDPGPVRLRISITRELAGRLRYIASQMKDDDGRPLPFTDLARRFIADGVTRTIGKI